MQHQFETEPCRGLNEAEGRGRKNIKQSVSYGSARLTPGISAAFFFFIQSLILGWAPGHFLRKGSWHYFETRARAGQSCPGTMWGILNDAFENFVRVLTGMGACRMLDANHDLNNIWPEDIKVKTCNKSDKTLGSLPTTTLSPGVFWLGRGPSRWFNFPA